MAFLGEQSVTRRRFAAPSYSAGRPVFGAATDSTFLASVQPLPERDRQVLPEGIRHRDGRKLYAARNTLRVDDQHAGVVADQVLIDAVVYTTVHTDDSHPLIFHGRYWVVRLQEGS